MAPRPRLAYLRGMGFFSRLNPLTAVRDLRRFLAMRQKHELIFGFLSVFVTTLLIVGFYIDSEGMRKPWKRDIMYVQDWPLDRSLEQIQAQQKIDMEKKKAQQAELEKRRRERQAEFKKVDDALDRLGI